jgi:NitT/TauT family transport system substrate-binding protein
MSLLNLRRIGRLAYLVAAAFVLVSAAPARAQTGVKFSLDGRLEGPEALILVPQDKGFFKSQGLEVSVDDAAAPLEPITRVATGGYDMALADINALIRYRAQHPSPPVKAVFVVFNKPPYAIVARKSRGITEPKQLEGKKLGAPPAGSTFAQWPLASVGSRRYGSKNRSIRSGWSTPSRPNPKRTIFSTPRSCRRPRSAR